MKIRKIRQSEDGVVGIVVAVLLIGLVVSVISLLQLVYVPNWMEQREAEHMDQVDAQFAQLKFVIDTQSALGAMGQTNTPIATSITLGSKELPFLMSARSFGQLDILEGAFSIKITNTSGYFINYSGIIKYSSVNAYFVNQEFIYESGAIITNQQQGNMMSIKPAFSANKNSSSSLINFTLINILSVGGKISSGGFDTTAIQTEFSSNKSANYSDVSSINISTSYPNSWYSFINSTLAKTFVYNADYNIIKNETTNYVRINIILNDVKVDLKIINILAQIGPGWVE